MIRAAGAMDGSREAQLALGELSERYWFPIYAFVRRREADAQRAEDLTQGFFCELIEKDELARVDRQRGRFRSFLLTALRHYMVRQKEHAGALKRGGAHSVLSLDRTQGESRLAWAADEGLTPEEAFERDWAVCQLEAAMARLQAEYEGSGRGQLFEALRPWLAGQPEQDQASLAQDLGMQPGALKVALHRLRQRMGLAVRAEVAETVEGPAEVDEELALLFRALSGP